MTPPPLSLALSLVLAAKVENAGRPADAADEVAMGVVEGLDTFALLREVPAADSLVVADAEEVLPAGVEDEAAYPVVVPD